VFCRENKKKAYGESAGRRKEEKKGESGMSEVGRLKEGKAKGMRKEKEVKRG
jgi:hypothetical protein